MSLLGSLGGVLGRVAGGALGFATGGVGGAIAGFIGQPKPPGTAMTVPAGPGAAPSMFGGGGFNMPFPVMGPGGLPLPGFNPGGVVVAQNGACPKGYHLNRKALGASKRHGAVAPGTMCVRNRHINALNAKAITRSLRRVKRARKLVAKLHAFTPVRRITSGGHKPGCGCFRCRKR